MATYLWSTLANGLVINSFDPNSDVLRFDDTSISAAAVFAYFGDVSPFGSPPPPLTLTYGGKTVTVQMNTNPRSITTTNVIFDNGSLLLVGDNTTGTDNDNVANTLTGGSGNDQFFGLGGDDSLSGGGGDDLFTMAGHNITGALGDDTVTGGDGTDYMFFPQNAVVAGINVNFNLGYTDAGGIQGTVTGGDINSTISVSGVEGVTGTNLADTFTANSLTPVRGLSTDITQIFDGAGGNDTINGATGDGRTTMLLYQFAPTGVTVNLGTGTASDGRGGTDTFNNIDGVRGSLFNDTLTGGGASLNMTGGLFEFFEGMAGNDAIDGGGGVDMAVYSGNLAAYALNSAQGTVSGPDGSDTLSNIERLQFSDKNLAFDLGLNTAGGNTVRIIGAAFDTNYIIPEFVGIGLDLFDGGMSMQAVCQLVLGTNLFLSLAGSNSNEAFVNLVYENVVGAPPSPAERDFYVGLLQGSGGTMTQAELLVLAANADVNAVNIDLVGLQASGVEFV